MNSKELVGCKGVKIPLPLGTCLFSTYEVLESLGQGANSEVFLARNLRVGNLVAIKRVPKNQGDDNLKREINLLRELRHSGIPVIIDVGEDEGASYLIEEYIEGQTLKVLAGRMNEGQVVEIMLQLCDILTYLHTSKELPIIYKDLKPSNIIMMANGRIKLVDFGAAVRQSDKTGQHLGTRGYAAPEQYTRLPVDERTDLFSLGVVAYYLLTGKNLAMPPYRLQPICEIKEEIRPGFEKLLEKVTKARPIDRFQSADQLKVALEDLSMNHSRDQSLVQLIRSTHLLVLVYGIKRSVGTSHIGFLIASHSASLGYRTSYIESNDHDDFSKILWMHPAQVDGRYHFDLKGIHVYPKAGQGAIDALCQKNYDVTVLDGGVFDGLKMDKEHGGNLKVLLVTGTRDWEVSILEELMLNEGVKGIQLVFNLSDKKEVDPIAESMSLEDYLVCPFTPDPYTGNQESCLFTGQILGKETFREEARPIEHKFKKKIKAWIQKYLVRFETQSEDL